MSRVIKLEKENKILLDLNYKLDSKIKSLTKIMSVNKEDKKEIDDDLILTFKEILSVSKEMGKINSDQAEIKLDMIRSDKQLL